MIAAAVLLAELCAIPATPDLSTLPASGCPQVFLVRSPEAAGTTMNLLFLPAGFDETELPSYRCAVARLVEGLLATPPFSSHECRINAYRIDLSDPGAASGLSVGTRCAASGCANGRSDWSPDETACQDLASRYLVSQYPEMGIPTRSGDPPECLESSLGVVFCPDGTPDCRVLWPNESTDIARIWQLTFCAPSPNAVIIVANTNVRAGGGIFTTSPRLAVVGIDAIAQAVPEVRSNLLAHELGHALGLLDEYDSDVVGDVSTEYVAGRNVVREGEDVPWASLCTPQAGDCGKSCGPWCQTEDCCERASSRDEVVGLRQGAFYQSCCYFRSQSVCRMQDLFWPFCVVCAGWIDGLFEDGDCTPLFDVRNLRRTDVR